MNVNYYKTIPEGFLECAPEDLHKIFSGPSIIELKGEKDAPFFISTMLHGNETSGLYVLQKLLKKYSSKNNVLPRSLIIFIGNVTPAQYGVRKLQDGIDYNRIWSLGNTPEHHMAEEVKAFVKSRNPFAVIDIHNTTGKHPYYAAINVFDPPVLHLAKMFNRQVVYFIKPEEVLTIGFKDIAPAITLECGQSSDMAGVAHTVDFFEKLFLLEEIPTTPVSDDEIHIFHSLCRIKLPKKFSVSFDSQQTHHADFSFPDNLEDLNFKELPEHTLLGWRNNLTAYLNVVDENGDDVSGDFITYDGYEIRLKRSTVPCMFCSSETIIRQDCLGYFMQRYRLR